jgi:hypothetical protein
MSPSRFDPFAASRLRGFAASRPTRSAGYDVRRVLVLSTLWVSHNAVRDLNQVRRMVAHVRGGGRFAPSDAPAEADAPMPATPIVINRFETGLLVLHDGHHRCVAAWLGGHRTLSAAEYRVWEFRLADYREMNLDNEWVTPFDPVAEVRAPDFFAYRDEAMRLLKVDRDRAAAFIRASRSAYAEPRRVTTVPELAELTARQLR